VQVSIAHLSLAVQPASVGDPDLPFPVVRAVPSAGILWSVCMYFSKVSYRCASTVSQGHYAALRTAQSQRWLGQAVEMFVDATELLTNDMVIWIRSRQE
jgi:hypothetical protein